MDSVLYLITGTVFLMPTAVVFTFIAVDLLLNDR